LPHITLVPQEMPQLTKNGPKDQLAKNAKKYPKDRKSNVGRKDRKGVPERTHKKDLMEGWGAKTFNGSILCGPCATLPENAGLSDFVAVILIPKHNYGVRN